MYFPIAKWSFSKRSHFQTSVSSYIICGEAHIKLAIFLSFRGLNIHAKHSFTCLLNLQIAMKCSVEFLGKNFEICSLTSLSIFALEMEDIEAKNSLAMASPKSVEDTWVQYCHRGWPWCIVTKSVRTSFAALTQLHFTISDQLENVAQRTFSATTSAPWRAYCPQSDIFKEVRPDHCALWEKVKYRTGWIRTFFFVPQIIYFSLGWHRSFCVIVGRDTDPCPASVPERL